MHAGEIHRNRHIVLPFIHPSPQHLTNRFHLFSSLQIIQGIDIRSVISNSKVAMVAGGDTGGTHAGDLLSLIDMVAHADQ